MTRYVARRETPVRRADDDASHDEPLLPSLTVYDTPERPTGLYDSRGNEYVAVMDRIGFVRHGDGWNR